ncbi:MAG: V-type proton ATPase subunit G [archaeon]|nr:V-type proton ATPase subunit G [archaeon]
MLESNSFETVFNDWYKKFLKEESEMNAEIKNAKKYRDEKIAKAREEADETIKNYEIEQRDKLESDKEKLNVTKNYFDQMDVDFQKEVDTMKAMHKQNKDKVIDFIIQETLNVNMDLPASYCKDKVENKMVKKIEDF